jgi:hypothetical protein
MKEVIETDFIKCKLAGGGEIAFGKERVGTAA